MANEEHIAVLQKGQGRWNQWRQNNPQIIPDFRSASFRCCKFRSADFRSADLRYVNLRRTDLRKANFSEANLCAANCYYAIFHSADLRYANLSEANLRKANFHSADCLYANFHHADLSGANLRYANLSYANLRNIYCCNSDLYNSHLRNSDLRNANFHAANLCNSDLYNVNLSSTDLSKANLQNANLQNANLQNANLQNADLEKAHLRGANLQNANLQNANLQNADLSKAQLRGADFSGTDLSGFNLCGVDLSNSVLCSTNLNMLQALATNFSKVNLTGACIADWNINSFTNMDEVICEYVYLKNEAGEFAERRPSSGKFSPGDFAKLVQKSINTVDLIFRNGMNWDAFAQSFQKLQVQIGSNELHIQSIENKGDGDFIIRVNAPPSLDKAKIQEFVMEKYDVALKMLEVQYEERLKLQGAHLEDARQTIEDERKEKATLMSVLKTMAHSQGPKFDMRGVKFSGGFAETVKRDQVGGTQYNYDAPEKQFLAEAAAEIQDLLKQLEDSNPHATEVEQIDYLKIMIPPTQRDRFIGAIRSAAGAAIEEIPYGSVLNALVEGWQNPNS